MDDLMLMQVHHKVADYHRMMARVNGAGGVVPPPNPPPGVRETIARSLVSLATRLAPLATEAHTA